MPLIDATEWFKDPGVNWALRGGAFVNQFAAYAQPMRGVYAHLEMNASDLPIYDKNGPGKIIVFDSTMGLKFGKFEGGLAGRVLQNRDHFHRRRPDGSREEGIFPDVLTCLLVLDLSHRPQNAVRPFETAWNRSIRSELRTRGLIHGEHRGRAESVNLARPISPAELREIVEPIAAQMHPQG